MKVQQIIIYSRLVVQQIVVQRCNRLYICNVVGLIVPVSGIKYEYINVKTHSAKLHWSVNIQKQLVTVIMFHSCICDNICNTFYSNLNLFF